MTQPSRAFLRRAGRLLPALALLAAACADGPTAVGFDAPVDLALEWSTASAAEVGMDPEALVRAASQAQAIPRFRSLLVVRRGRLVLERYFGGSTRDDLADVRSVTKSVVSTLAGLAVERGHLTGLDATLGEVLPADTPGLDDWERAITVRDLLTMSGGWNWYEQGAVGYNDWIVSTDHVGYLLAAPRAAEPGTTFAYNSAAAHLLGVVLTHATGKSLPAFADEVLFGPLGIGTRVWEAMGDAEANGGAGLDLRPRDLARLGQLFIQDGWSGDRRILPDGWVEEATRPYFSWTSSAGPTHVSYGYLWWVDVDHDAYLAWGYGGQFIYVAPDRDLVVVATTDWRSGAPADLSYQALGVIVNGVLPAAPRDAR